MKTMPEVRSFHHDPTGTWTHLVWDPASGRAAVVDPVLDYDAASARTGAAAAEEVAAAVERDGLTVDWVLETHAHADHLTAAQWFRSRYGCPVAIGRGIREVQANFRAIYGLGDAFPADGRQFDRLFDDGDVEPLGSLAIRVLATPGHTADSVTYLIGDAAFVGDTLFAPAAGTARCDFPGGDAHCLYRSIQRLFALGDDTRLFLCHDYPEPGETLRACATVGEQRADNVHVGGGRAEAEFVALREARDRTLSMPELILPALQVNIRAGHLPPPEADGRIYLRIPVDRI
jgi:glyoxylase-like metal-dependent hydrolase (beta-lactamase superfamily II)